ncbi:serine-protein kinase ATM [Aricia agestis]|uniref:serine-protein kinase ATM n=1 Tax=Aricia agestis TaxID=91739 RepID=UPI001C20819D|nr:serine-protein kinase ATM [Aricia agestis]
MSLESSIQEICTNLTSNRVMERKKSAENLKDFLTRNAVPSLLTANTFKMSGLTWNILFDDINNFIILETKKIETSKNFKTVIAPLCKNLLHLCLAGSNKGKAYIKCEKITDACLYILNDKRLANAIGDAYLTLLSKFVLPVDYYIGCISSATWEEILEVSLSACLSNKSELDDFVKMRLVLYIVKSASNNCQFTVPLRDSLPKFMEYFMKISNDKKVQDFIMETIIVLIEVVAPDSHLTMCEFTKKNLPMIFKFYLPSMEQKKKTLLFTILKMSMKLLYPITEDENLENNTNGTDILKRHLNSILEISCLEIEYTKKNRKTNEVTEYNDFPFVAAAAFYQVFKMTNPNEDVCENTAKKSRVTFNKHKTFEDLVQELKFNPHPWIKIIEMYIRTYGHSLTQADYLSIIKTSEHIISNTQKGLDFEAAEQLIRLSVGKMNDTKCDEAYEALLSLWNTCLRNVAVSNTSNRAVHSIVQSILKLNVLKYPVVQPLLQMYFEKGMPISNNSFKTLNVLLNKFHNKCSYLDIRMKLLSWITTGKIVDVDNLAIEDILIRLICIENFALKQTEIKKDNRESFYNLLTTSKCDIFDYNLEVAPKKDTTSNDQDSYEEMRSEINFLIMQYLEELMSSSLEEFKEKRMPFKEFSKVTSIVLDYLKIILKYKLKKAEGVRTSHLYTLLQKSLKLLYTNLAVTLQSDVLIKEKIIALKCIQSILSQEYVEILSTEVRKHIGDDCFHAISKAMKVEISEDDEEMVYEADLEVNKQGLKQSCIYVLASYCRKRCTYAEELQKCILDKDLYDFTSHWDVECALKCINILIEPQVESRPFDLIFCLMQNMCKELFRNTKATYGLLQILSGIFEEIWHLDNSMLKKNSIIMVKSYLSRCTKKFYPPHVAVLVYECVAKIIDLNNKTDLELDEALKESLVDAIVNGDTHTIRIYCCHLLKFIAKHYTENDIENFGENLKDIFVTNISSTNDLTIKDELTNRTLTVLYSLYVLGVTKNNLVSKIVVTTLQLQVGKMLSKDMVTTMLDQLTQRVTSLKINEYLNTKILYILYYWFSIKRKTFEDLPYYLFGFVESKSFVEKHIKWLVPSETLWRCNGDMTKSAALKYICAQTGRTKEQVVEICFCNIIILCLPYVVVNKYKLENETHMMLGSEAANKLFQATRLLLNNEKWSNLFVENLGELLRLTAAHTHTRTQTNTYTFSKGVYKAILSYFGELTDGNIMQYLCETQSLVIFNILFKLWATVDSELVFETKTASFQTYLNFVDSIPLGFVSDALLFNFICSSLIHALKTGKNDDEIKLFSDGMIVILQKISNHSAKDTGFLRKSLVSEILSAVSFNNDRGFKSCDSLASFVRDDFQEYFAESLDVPDNAASIHYASKVMFVDKLKSYISNLTNASPEVLVNMASLLRQNRELVKELTLELNVKGFSDDCGRSPIHQTITALCSMLKSSASDKIIVAAGSCLAEIGSYDLKTLVTIPPLDTNRIVTIHPKMYLATQVLSSLCAILLDSDTHVANEVAKAINTVLMFRDGKASLEFCDSKVLQSLSPSSCEVYSEYEVDVEKFEAHNSIMGSWVPTKGEDHDTWVTRVTLSLLDVVVSPANYMKALGSVCAAKPSVCCQVLPALMGQILECANEAQTRVLGEQVNHVFKYVWDVSFEESLESSDDASGSRPPSVVDHDLKTIIQSLLDVVDFVRVQKDHYPIRRRAADGNYLQLEYDRVSWAAAAADEHLAAVYYGELALAARPLEHMQAIFRKCFMAIGELDAIDGCGIAHLTGEEEKRRHLISTGQYSDSLLVHDIALSRGNMERDLQRGTVLSLHKSGMHHLALQYIKSLPENEELNNIKYECLSYLGDWSDFVDTKQLYEESKTTTGNPRTIINAMRYACLKDCLTIQPNKYDKRLSKPLDRAKLATAALCKKLNMENCQNVYKIVGNLQVLRDIEDYFSVRCEDVSIDDIIKAWSVEMLPPFHDFKHLETIISQRTLILEHAASSYPSQVAQISALQLQYAELGLSNNRIQMAQRVVAAMKHIQDSDKVTLLESQVSWAKGHQDIALSLLNSILTKQSEDMKWTAISLRQYGLWMAESKRENARDILNNYLEKSKNILNETNDVETRLKVYHDIAKFADEEYKQVVNYMKSSVFEIKVKCMEDMKDTAATLDSTQQSLSRDEKKALLRFQRLNKGFKDLDEAEIANTKAEKESFLKLAMRYYLLSLAQSEENNLTIFRVISLWFDNPTLNLEDEDSGKLGQLINAIPTWKFITVLPQLAPRLNTQRDQFSNHLKTLILRCAKEHPHHTLPILFSLKNSDKDRSTLSSGAGSEERSKCAAALVAKVGGTGPHVALVRQMERVCDAIIAFAYLVPESKSLKPQAIPRTEEIAKLRHLDAVPVPTDTIPVRKDCDYSQIHTLSAFDKFYELVGGINYPKKVSCLSSDGKKRILLIKGEDDLRQDAVMQQVFNIVNTLLEKNPITYRSKLYIRTYKVVPMSRRAGALEWVMGTRPIGAILLPAHERYRPKDMTPAVARNKLKECHEQRRPTRYKLEVFKQILKSFKPVFHHYFTEQYLTPVKWYERRLAYTKSVAASSMVGYILGLGDRHVQNILIDETTAEVVHIDLGIAFDQGKTLPTPETVPFRLTQDIVAGFGCSGVDGVFRKCCEKTLQLLRDNQETLLTILEVLLCDPLYLWTNKKASTSNAGSSCSGALSERALLGVSDKLRGAEGRAGGVAVAGHVAGLLRAASDPVNLCQLFHGWQPYL